MSSFHRASLLTYFSPATAITNKTKTSTMVADTTPTHQITTLSDIENLRSATYLNCVRHFWRL
eukprot:scaffold113260_cov63-Cyclotella_meneghiniana.AAC.2